MNTTPPGSSYSVLIHGPSRLQNELICTFIHEGTPFSCTIVDDLNQVPIPPGEVKAQLFMFDGSGQPFEELATRLRQTHTTPQPPMLLALFNLDKESTVEGAALQLGVRGFFYESDPSCLLVKGVKAMFAGELWMPRKKMEDYILANRTPVPQPGAQSAELTTREREILALVATGANNDDIGRQLCISPHTVKTHIYNIFKKIDVSNRLEAAIWASNQGLANPAFIQPNESL